MALNNRLKGAKRIPKKKGGRRITSESGCGTIRGAGSGRASEIIGLP